MIDILNKIKDNKYEVNIKENILHIINYINIINLKDNEIIIELNEYNLLITGNQLLIRELDEKEILINGKVSKIELLEK